MRDRAQPRILDPGLLRRGLELECEHLQPRLADLAQPHVRGEAFGVSTVNASTGVEPGNLRVPYTVRPSCWRWYSVPLTVPSSPHRFGTLATLSSKCLATHFEPGSGAVDRLTLPSRMQR